MSTSIRERIELGARRVIAKLIKPNEMVVPTDPLKDTLAAFKLILKQDVAPDAELFYDVILDSIDLVEVCIALDQVYGERDWEPFFEKASTRMILKERPAITPRMVGEYLSTTVCTLPDA